MKELRPGCLIKFTLEDVVIKKGRIPQMGAIEAIGLVTNVDDHIIHVIHYSRNRNSFTTTGMNTRGMKYEIISSPIQDTTEFLLNQETTNETIKNIIKKHELVDPEDVYPVKERIDHNALNERTVEYDMETLIAACIRSHIALDYYRTIFNEIPEVRNYIQTADNPVESSEPIEVPIETNTKHSLSKFFVKDDTNMVTLPTNGDFYRVSSYEGTTSIGSFIASVEDKLQNEPMSLNQN